MRFSCTTWLLLPPIGGWARIDVRLNRVFLEEQAWLVDNCAHALGETFGTSLSTSHGSCVFPAFFYERVLRVFYEKWLGN